MSEIAPLDRAEIPAENNEKRGFFARIVLFVRQVVAEMKKVVYPTQTETRTYFTVVLVFVLVLMAFVGVVDLGFGYLAHFVFSFQG